MGLLAGLAAAQSYRVRTFTEADGLPNAFVNDIAQTPDGVLWILTRGSLVSFDGTAWNNYAIPIDNPGLMRLLVDGDGVPWCISWTGAIHALHHGVWVAYRTGDTLPADFRFDAALNDSNGEPFFVCFTPSRGPFVVRDHQWRRPLHAIPGADPLVLSAAACGDGFVFGTDSGLWQFDGREQWTSLNEKFGLPDGRVLALSQESGSDPRTSVDRFDGLWILSDRWIGIVRSGHFQVRATLATAPPISQSGTMRMVSSPSLGAFFGNELFGAHLPPGANEIHPFDKSAGLPDDGVRALLVDREHDVWIGQREGLSRLADLSFRQFDRTSGLAEDEVTALADLADGRVALGHGRAISELDGTEVRTRLLPARIRELEPYPRVMSLRAEADGGYWAAIWSSGVLHVDASGLEQYTESAAFGLDHVSDVDVAEAARIWVAGGCGIVAVERDGLREIPGTRSNTPLVRRLARARDGTLYALTAWNGVVRWRDGYWLTIRSLAQRELEDNWSLLEARDGRIWVGTRAGLAELTPFGLEPGPPELGNAIGMVFALAESPDGRLWLGTSDGVVEWDGNFARRITIENGLAGREVNRAALRVDDTNRLWVGTDRGLSLHALDAFDAPAPAPRVKLTDIEADGQRLDPYAPCALGPDLHTLIVRATAVSFVDERRVRCRWKLNGFDTEWLESVGGTHFETRYTSLPPGSYHFELAARASGGDWGETIRSATIEVEKPLWRRGWALVTALLGAVGVGWFVQKAWAQRRYARRLAGEVEARTRELSQSRADVVREKERLHATLESIVDGVLAVDATGKVAWLNGAAQRLVGATTNALVGRPLSSVLSIRREDGAPYDLSAGLASASVYEGALELLGRDGTARAIEIAFAPLSRGRADTRGAVIVLHDVSERMRLEREVARADRLRSLGILAGGIAHDFNNVLTALAGRVALIASDLDPASDGGRHAAAAEKALARARDLAHQLVTFARGGEPVRAPLALGELLDDACQLAFSGSRVRAVRDGESEPWPVEVDRTQVQQVFENVLINARQAMQLGGRVTVRVQNVLDGSKENASLAAGRYVRVEIEDEGAGIPPERLQHIFDPFFTTKDGGSGLGLATAYSVVQRHGGAITVRSTLGVGSCFSIHLPASSRPAEPVRVESRAESQIEARVLVVDDEADVREVLEAMLERLGTTAVCAETEDEAVQRWRDALERGQRFDAAFVDLTMPGGAGGVAIAKRVLELDPRAQLVAMSGYTADSVLAYPARHGFRTALSKPFRVQDVARALEIALADAARGGTAVLRA